MGGDQREDGAVLGQLLIEQGKIAANVATVVTDVAVIKEQMRQVPDHELRLRSLETARAKILGFAAGCGMLSGALTTLVYWALQARR